jgi:hypothetical protein
LTLAEAIQEEFMAGKCTIVAALITAFLTSSSILATAQTGGTGGVGGGVGTGGVGGGIGTAPGGVGTAPGGIGTAPGGIGTTTPGAVAPSAVAPGTSTGSGAAGSTLNSGSIGPGGIPLAPGASSSGGVPTQRVGPGGVPMAPGPAGDVSGNAFPTTTPGAASGSRPGCATASRNDVLGAGTTPNIMVEPGQRAPAIPSQAPATTGSSSITGTTVRPPGC